jgi:hypothetical protein
MMIHQMTSIFEELLCIGYTPLSKRLQLTIPNFQEDGYYSNIVFFSRTGFLNDLSKQIHRLFNIDQPIKQPWVLNKISIYLITVTFPAIPFSSTYDDSIFNTVIDTVDHNIAVKQFYMADDFIFIHDHNARRLLIHKQNIIDAVADQESFGVKIYYKTSAGNNKYAIIYKESVTDAINIATTVLKFAQKNPTNKYRTDDHIRIIVK